MQKIVIKNWEGYNILIPIETEYDYDTGTVYATNSMIGTYCLVDTDQMYDLLGIEKEEQEEKNLSKTVFKNEAEETEQKFYAPILKRLSKLNPDDDFAEAFAVLDNLII